MQTVNSSKLSQIEEDKNKLREELDSITRPVSEQELEALKLKSREISERFEKYVDDYSNDIESNGKLLLQSLELYEKSVESEMLKSKVTLMRSKLNALISWSPWVRWASGIFAIFFMVLWYKWQIKMDEKIT